MTTTYFPFDGGSGSAIVESQWRRLALPWGTGVIDTDVLGERLAVSGTGANGMTVTLDPGVAMICGHTFVNDAPIQLAVAPAHSTEQRIDAVVLRADFAANTITPLVKTNPTLGTANVPSLVQDLDTMYELLLAGVVVSPAVNEIAADKVTRDESRFLSSPAMPVGMFGAFAVPSDELPGGWVPCDGRSMVRWGASKLYLKIPDFSDARAWGRISTFGTMVLPDLRARMLMGMDDMGTAAGSADRIVGGQALGEVDGKYASDLEDLPWGVSIRGVFDPTPTWGIPPYQSGYLPVSMNTEDNGGSKNRLPALAYATMAVRVA